MKLCVPHKYWEAALMCADTDDVRYYLNGVHLSKNRIEATNGHVAYFAEFERYEVDGNQRLAGQNGWVSQEEYNGEWPDIIIGNFSTPPSKAVAKKTLYLLIDGDEHGVLTIKFVDNQFNVIYVQGASIIDARYPDFSRIMPKGEPSKEQFQIGFNPDYLALPAKLLYRENGRFFGTCAMTAWDSNLAAVIELKRFSRECEKEVLLIMPTRL